MNLVRPGRDLRVDFFRGIALYCIFLDHMRHNVLASFTVHNIALNDATEIFILLAGFAAALVYGRKMDRAGVVSGAADMLRRSWVLYIAHLFLFVLFVAEIAAAADLFGRPHYLSMIRLERLVTVPMSAFEDAALLRYQPSFLNILPLYVVIMAGFAFCLPLLRRPRLLLGLSFALYLATRVWGWNLHNVMSGRGWYFDPFAWQFLFVLGALFARYGRPDLPPRLTDAAAIILLLLGFLILLTNSLVTNLPPLVPPVIRPVIRDIDKTGLHPYRLLSILAMAWLASRHVAAEAGFLAGRAASLFVLIGQHGLNTFGASILLSFAGGVALDNNDGWGAQIVVNIVGLAALAGVAAISAWYRVKDEKPA